MSEPPAVDAQALRRTIAGAVVTSADPSWDAARQAWNLVADQRPALVVLAAGPDDVAAAVRFARSHGLRVAPQSTGHGATTLGDLAETILLRTDRMSGVTVDPAARTAQVPAGARWRDVIAAAGVHGLAGLHGFSGGVGVTGYVLGGGIGWLARREGFASSHVRSLDVVTADGEHRHVDAEHEPDLFWALRGGGGGPVAVTSIELELFALREAFAGSLMWPMEQAREIVQAYRAWVATVPDTLTSAVKLVRYPPLPDVPDPLRGRALVSVTLAFTGSEEEGNALVAPLRAVAPPYFQTLGVVPATALGDIAGDPPGPLPGLGGSLLLETLTEAAADAFVDLAGPDVPDSPLISLEIRQLGGALAAPASDPGAAGAVSAEGIVYGVGMPVSPEVAAAIGDTLGQVRERLAPWASARGTLLTFDEHDPSLRGSFAPETVARLTSIAAAHDPDGLFVANHVAG